MSAMFASAGVRLTAIDGDGDLPGQHHCRPSADSRRGGRRDDQPATTTEQFNGSSHDVPSTAAVAVRRVSAHSQRDVLSELHDHGWSPRQVAGLADRPPHRNPDSHRT